MFAVSVADVLGVRGGGQKCLVSEETFILMDNSISEENDFFFF